MDPAVFKGMRLCVSTPMYRYEVCGAYQDSLREIHRYLAGAGIGYYAHKVADTYLDRARNILVAAFRESDATHILFLDADMGFNAPDILRMVWHAANNPKIWVIGAPYPQRSIDWNRVKKAVLKNPDITAEQLECVAPGQWTYSGLPTGQYNIGEPILLAGEHPHVATGCVLISRKAFEAMEPHAKTYFDKRAGKKVTRFFHCDVIPEDDDFRGEDVWFCREAVEKAGVRLWLAPWVKTEHWGIHCFRGDLEKVVDAGIEVA